MRRLLGIFVSLIILGLIWWQVDVDAILAATRAADRAWLALGLGMVIPLTLATAWRFRLLSRTHLSVGSAVRLILSASTLNLFLPSKLGDLAKSWVLTSRYGYDPKLALALVVLEKLLDLASLLAWGVLALLWIAGGNPWLYLAAAGVGGLLLLLLVLILPIGIAPALMRLLGGLLPGKAGRAALGFTDEWSDTTRWFWRERARAATVVAASLALWAGHLAQFWLFARALEAAVPFLDNMAFATLSILAGLLPFTMAGIGTRDAAIVYFYQPWLSPGQGTVLGVLATLRYLIPAVAGLPFVRDYWQRAKAAQPA